MDAPSKLQMVIFDLDGTIINNSQVYKQAFAKVLADLGIKEDFKLIGSAGIAHNWTHLIIDFNIKTDKTPDELTELTQKEYLKNIDEVAVRDGFLEFVEDLKNNNILIGLATSNNFSVTDIVLQKFHLTDIFEVVTTLEEARFPKPDPELFLLTARKLDIEPQNCIVIEDAKAGIVAAHDANMIVICLGNVDTADLTFQNYDELSFNKLNKLHEESNTIN